MSDVLLDSREVEKLLDLKPSTLRWMAESLGLERGRKGVARRWSLGELTSLVVAQRLADRGFTVQAATSIARVFDERQFVRLVADDAAELYAVAFPKGSGAFETHVVETKSQGAEIAFASGAGRDPVVVDLRRMFDEAFRLVAEARQEARR